MQLRLSLTLAMIALTLVGCGRFSPNNHSLDYKKTQPIAALEIPEDSRMRPQQALYPAPIISPEALAQAPEFRNERGNRFAMPRAETPSAVAPAAATGVSVPQLVVDGNQIPLLKVDGDAESTWKHVLSAVSTANLSSSNSSTPYQLSVQYQQQTYLLRLSPTGSSNVIGVYTNGANFADNDTANELLTLIVQNWPA